ncbi:MAG: O-antigen ligase family protein [Actinobacteria bacterium]|nr:O-antigen ligase family protein [Actinomycetota bacterium]
MAVPKQSQPAPPAELAAGGAGGRRTAAYRYSRAAIFVFLAATVDVLNFLDRGGQARYLLLLVPVGAVAAIRLRRPSGVIRRLAPVDRVLLALWLFGLAGTLYGAFVKGSSTTARPLFVPMSIGFLYLFVLDRPTEAETERLLRAISWIGAIYILLAAVVNTGFVPGLAAYKQFRNAQFGFEAIGLAAALVLRKRGLLFVLVVAALFNFAAYPSATSVLAVAGVLITLFITRPTASSARPYIVALLLALAVVVALLNMQSVVGIANDYFATVHKVNANYGRLAVWTAGIDQFRQSPLVGKVFSGGTVAVATRFRAGSTLQIPYHNDYVLFLAEGGMIGFGLLIAFVALLEFTIVRRYWGFIQTGQIARANLLRILLCGFNAFFAAAAFNPVLEGMSRSATIFALYGLVMLQGAPGDPEPEPASVSPARPARSIGRT